MRKFRFAIVAMAALALTACNDDNFNGGEEPANALKGTAIEFGPGFRAVTRAAVGGDAADSLGNKFIVYGAKSDGTDLTEVFDNYQVQWAQNTAGKTASNTNDWEYVGLPVPVCSPLYDASDNPDQTIKYWDYSASSYEFAAYSVGKGVTLTTGTPSAGQVKVSAITNDATNGITYTLQGAEADLAKCYISNKVVVNNKANYNKVVQLEFRSMAAKVRVAMYETVPGYAVKNVQFYSVDNANNADLSTATKTGNVTLFSNTNAFFTSGQYTVSFPNATNEAHVALSASGGQTSRSFGALSYGASNALGTDLTLATYNADGYVTVLPNENGVDLELRVDYTLESLDGSGETIVVHGAKAFVPQIYAKWMPNYAYTYVFKISDNSNGWTSLDPDDPEGLFPITFDAVVVDSEENTQSTITTVATPSVTTYQKGHDPEAQDEYEVLSENPEIYVRLMNNGTLVDDLDDTGKSKLYELSPATATEVDVMAALNIGRNGLTLTEATIDNEIESILGPDGNTITVTKGTAAKFTPVAGKTYAYVYLVQAGTPSDHYTAVKFASQPADWSTAGLYYTKPDGSEAATTFVANKVYYMKYTNQNNVYAVKVIKIKN